MADRAREALDAYAARSAGDDGGNSIGTIGELASQAITVLGDLLDRHTAMEGYCVECGHLGPCPTIRDITTAMEAP